METITGLAFLANATSRQMTSEPTEDPPGLSIRRTMALTDGSVRAVRTQRATVEPPMI